MVIKLKGPKEGGEGTFSLPFELYVFGFSRHKFGQEPNLALQRVGQKPILNYPDLMRSKGLIANPQAPRRCWMPKFNTFHINLP
jgi:hypothetical protein